MLDSHEQEWHKSNKVENHWSNLTVKLILKSNNDFLDIFIKTRIVLNWFLKFSKDDKKTLKQKQKLIVF